MPQTSDSSQEAVEPFTFQGLEDLREDDRDVYFKEFGVKASEAKAYNEQHPAPAEQPSPPPAKKRKTVCGPCQCSYDNL